MLFASSHCTLTSTRTFVSVVRRKTRHTELAPREGWQWGVLR